MGGGEGERERTEHKDTITNTKTLTNNIKEKGRQTERKKSTERE